MAKRYSQPQQAVGIDRSNPLTSRLEAVFNPALFGRNYVTNALHLVTKYGSSALVPTPFGLSVASSGGGYTLASNGIENNLKTEISAVVSFIPKSGGETIFGSVGTAYGTNNWRIRQTATYLLVEVVNEAGVTATCNLYVANWFDKTSPIIAGFSYSSSTGVVSAYCNIAIKQTAALTGLVRSAAVPINFGFNLNGDGAYTGKTHFAAAWSRIVTEPEFNNLFSNPWQIFAPTKQTFSVASGGNAALAGNAQSIVSASGALSAALPLAGAAISVATASGQVSAAFPLSGVAAAIASAAGNMKLGLALSGIALAQAVASGALSEAFPLAGGAVAQLAANGSLSIQFALSGSAVAQAVAAGNLSAGSGSSLAGNAQAQAAASGSLSVAIPLSGSAQVVATASGNLGSGSQLAGAAVAVAVASGNLSVTVTLSGQAVAQAIAAGGLSIQIPLSGGAVVSASASGYLSGGLAPIVSDPRYTVTRSARAFAVLANKRDFTVLANKRNFTVSNAS